jgi:hypothetical protein
MAKILKADAERLLGDVPGEYVFRSYDGEILRNLRDLAHALSVMTDETFAFHVGAQKNDFSNWVRDIIKEKKLAADLAKSPSRSESATRVADRITFLSKKLG